MILSYFINIIYNICIYILSIKYNNARENKTTARAIGKLVCSTPLEIPIENVLSQRKLRVGLTVYNGILLQRRQKLMYHLKYLFFNLQLFDPLLVVLITLMRHLHVTVINSFNVCMSQRGVP